MNRCLILHSSTGKMETAGCSQSSVNYNRTTRRHIAEAGYIAGYIASCLTQNKLLLLQVRLTWQQKLFGVICTHTRTQIYLHTHTHTNIYYIYICVCVCVCVCRLTLEETFHLNGTDTVLNTRNVQSDLVPSYVYWTVHHCSSRRIKDQLDVTCCFVSLLMCSTCFGH